MSALLSTLLAVTLVPLLLIGWTVVQRRWGDVFGAVDASGDVLAGRGERCGGACAACDDDGGARGSPGRSPGGGACDVRACDRRGGDGSGHCGRRNGGGCERLGGNGGG